MFKSLNLALIATIPLFGCSAIQYEHPSDENAPSLTFINQTNANVAVLGYKDAAACIKQINISPQSSRYMGLTPGRKEQIKIRPNEPFSFLVSLSSFPKECFMIGTLTPSALKNYVVIVTKDARMCYLSLRRIENGNAVTDAAFVPRAAKMPLTDSFSACADTLPSNSIRPGAGTPDNIEQ